jgi:hypothetical protein
MQSELIKDAFEEVYDLLVRLLSQQRERMEMS